MPAAVVKGILISISIITALGLVILENPYVQTWLEEQRQKIMELLRTIGEELDPESRRQAEAFAYEGRTPANDAGLKREASTSKDAAAVATGMSLDSPSAVRRIPMQGRVSSDEAEERRRKGREYLAKRNETMYELQQKRMAAKEAGMAVPPSPATFDDLIDAEGRLKTEDTNELSLPSPPTMDPLPAAIRDGMRAVEHHLAQPVPATIPSSSGMSAFHLGAQLADPFGDEFALERSVTPRPLDRAATPKPPVPPKVRFDEETQQIPAPIPAAPTDTDADSEAHQDSDELSFEEQMAIALSISEAETSATAATVHQRQSRHEDDLRAAIEASLREMDDSQAAHAIARGEPVTPRPALEDSQPLVDLRPAVLLGPPAMRHARSDWDRVFDPQSYISREPAARTRPAPSTSADSDDLYRLTPELTRARLASHNSQTTSSPRSLQPKAPYDPIREAANANNERADEVMQSSFHSAPSAVAAPPQLVDVSEHPAPVPSSPHMIHAPSEIASVEFDSDDLEFASAQVSRTQSHARSETSTVEVVHDAADSDAGMLSDDDDDGIMTPDSWTEVGSQDGESDVEDHDRREDTHVTL
nr:hypothetical protein CFP56_16955 [Quercus suber]